MTKTQICATLGLLLTLGSSIGYADGLQALGEQDLQEVTGQGGADLSLVLRLNHTNTNPNNFDDPLNAQSNCVDLVYCRLAISLNNRNDDGTPTGSPTGKKQWLVFKGIQGSINIQEIKLDGTDVIYGSVIKPAVQLSFDDLKPIKFRNVGFESLSIETDTVANEGAGNLPGYLVPATLYGGVGFDSDKEKGFLGVNMHGNLAIGGTLKIFSCDAGHPRC